MNKYKRNERIASIIRILTENPNCVFTYSYFTEKFNAAKSTISEDIMITKETLSKLQLGEIHTIPGAAGGVKYLPLINKEDIKNILNDLSNKLSNKDRIVPGNFIFMTDILYCPNTVHNIGKIFATVFRKKKLDYVVTVEMKGIPLALMTAKLLNVPLVIIRNNTKVTEGPTVSINYVTGSTKKINTMSLSRRALKEDSNVLVIDDFMKAGGTAKGIKDMMKEFKCNVVGTGIFISTEDPSDKLVDNYISLLTLKTTDTNKDGIIIEPNINLLNNI